ncbi:MAG: prepilin-type N-terminal cleavage/methylation domain-containing protein, partial [Elusimicrobiaceae bacterium]|nr:prepilin-type N-terminal cleavage/methylation domain-containing protein [Elusimicrobiaceae bacterium]
MNNTGFTLLELLMVALIMSILVSVAVPQYMKSAERARATEALT